jgi:hypothetical protein
VLRADLPAATAESQALLARLLGSR